MSRHVPSHPLASRPSSVWWRCFLHDCRVQVQTCSLEEIFGCREGRSGAYAKRTSSARWDLDTLTLVGTAPLLSICPCPPLPVPSCRPGLSV